MKMSFLDDLFGPLYGAPKIPELNDPHTKKEVESLIKELITIGSKEDYLSERPGGAFDGQCHHRRCREIGKRLDAIGGMPLMQFVFEKVRKKNGKILGEHLEYAWADIGKWMP
jgi:hypothetical protein